MKLNQEILKSAIFSELQFKEIGKIFGEANKVLEKMIKLEPKAFETFLEKTKIFKNLAEYDEGFDFFYDYQTCKRDYLIALSVLETDKQKKNELLELAKKYDLRIPDIDSIEYTSDEFYERSSGIEFYQFKER